VAARRAAGALPAAEVFLDQRDGLLRAAQHAHVAGMRSEQGREHAQKGRLACPVRAEHRERLTRLDAQADPVERRSLAVPAHEAFELDRGRLRLAAAVDEIATGKISGPVGTYSHLGPDVEAEVKRLGPVGAFLIGDEKALSPTVVSDLIRAGLPAEKIFRLAGGDVADTARLVADTYVKLEKAASRPVPDTAVIINPTSHEAGAAANLAASLRYPVLFAELRARGYSDDELRRIAGRNVLRALRRAEHVAHDLQSTRGPSLVRITDSPG